MVLIYRYVSIIYIDLSDPPPIPYSQRIDAFAIIMRFYDKDPAGCGNRKEQFWGFADPPKVEKLKKTRKVKNTHPFLG